MSERDDKDSSTESQPPAAQDQADPSDKTDEVVGQLKGAPKEVISSITSVLRGSFRPPHPVYDKFETEHVSTWLNNVRAGTKRNLNSRNPLGDIISPT